MVRSPVEKPISYVSGLLSGRRKTPYLVLSRPVISRKVAEFCRGNPSAAVYYALKANPDARLVSLMYEQGMGFEISSQQELRALLREGIPSSRIISSNPIKSPSFIRQAYRAGIDAFVADSLVEVQKLQRNAPESKLMVRLAVDNAGSEWPLDEKFGAEPETALQVFRYGAELGLKPEGITFHVGSQCTALDSWSKALEKVSGVWHRLEDEGIYLHTLNLGGGFPIVYGKEVPSVSQVMDVVSTQMQSLFPKDLCLQLEPGRALVGDAGTMVSRVIGKATRGEEEWLYLDVGVFNGLMESLGGIRYEFCTSGSGPGRRWVLAGPSCDSMDVIARDVWLPEPAIGDYVFVLAAGAYTTSYSSRFNGCRIPDTYLVDES